MRFLLKMGRFSSKCHVFSMSKTLVFVELYRVWKTTLQGTNISHLGKRNIIFKMPLKGDMLVPRRVPNYSIWGMIISYANIVLPPQEANLSGSRTKITGRDVLCWVENKQPLSNQGARYIHGLIHLAIDSCIYILYTYFFLRFMYCLFHFNPWKICQPISNSRQTVG